MLPPRLAVLLAGVLLAGCYRLKQYNADDYVLHGGSPAAPYSIQFVEFDDQGVKYSARQLDNVVQRLRTDRKKLVVVFAHGWFHNVERDDSNLAFFGNVLGQVAGLECASAAQEGRSPREVSGVLLGWRGAAWRVPVAKYLTFWNRKDTAHRIGEREATEAILRIQQAAYGPAQDAQPHPTRLVLMGHSFGGALVYSALSQLLVKSLTDGSESKIADAVVLFNPAFEAARWEHLARLPTSARKLPKIVVLTSKTDRATGWAFPFGRWFNTLAQRTRRIENPVFPGTIRERKANNKAIGHFQPFITHDLRAIDEDKGECPGHDPARDLDADAVRERPNPAQAQTSRELLAAIYDAYEAGDRPMHFGKTCLVPRKNLLRPQSNVFNIAMDRAVWKDHDFEQTGKRRERTLSFLTLLVPFMGATKPVVEEAAPSEAQPARRPRLVF